MNTNEKRRKIWFSITVDEIIPKLGMPGLTPEFIPDVCQYNPQKITDVAMQSVYTTLQEIDANVVVIAVTLPMPRTADSLECIVVLGGEPGELEKVADYGLPFEKMIESERQDVERFERRKQELLSDAPTQYERMKQSAFNLMRKKNIKNFSDEELHRVFKHAKEQLLYMSIVRTAIEDGLTINSLYEQDHERDLGR